MKFNRFILVSIILLAILTLGAVSASDNLTATEDAQDSVLAVEDNDLIADDSVQEIVGEDEVGNDITKFDVVFPDSVKAMEYYKFSVYAPNGTSGEITVYRDGDDYDSEDIYGGGITNKSFKFNTIGKHTLKVDFTSNDGKTQSFSKSYNINDYSASITLYLETDDIIVYGKSADFEVTFPSDVSGNAVVFINGEKFMQYYFDDDNEFYFRIPSVRAPQLNVTVSYEGNNKYKAKTITKIFDVGADVQIPDYVAFNENPYVTVNYYDGGVVNLRICESWDGTEMILEKNVTCTGERTKYYLEGDYGLGDSYWIFASPSGYYEGYSFRIGPKINVDKKVWVEDFNNVTLEFPTGYAGETVFIELDGERIFEGALGSDGKVSVPVNNISADGHYLNFGIEGGISWYNNLYVISENPSMNFSIYVPDKVAIGSTIPVNVPDSEQATGIVFVYLDGDLKNTCIYREETVLSTEGLEIGNHTISVIYEGDDYFKPAQCNVTFEIVEHIITVPQTVIINQDDRAYVRLPADAAGTLKFYIDGKLLDEIDYVDDDYDEYGHVYVVDLSKCDVSKSHTLKVSFLGDSKYSKFTESYKFAMNFTFAFRLSDIEYSFGDENTVTIVCPYGIKSGFDILIDGVKFTKYEIEDYEETQVVVDISEFAGTHDIAVDFKGNAKYSPLKVNTTFTVYPHIDYTYDNYYRDEGSVVKLLLPKDAKGNLVVEIDDKNYAKVPIANGQANVSFANLSLGYHNIKTYYDGADYEVENKSGEISIVGGIVINSNEFIYGDSLTVTLNLPSDANGTLKTSFNGVDKEVRISNGSAKITYSNLKVGLFELYAQYVDNDEYGYSVNSISEGISTYPKLSISDKMVVFANNPVTLISNSGVEGQMEVEFGDDSYYVNLKNGKAAYSLSKLTAGKHTIRVYFTNDDLYYDYGKFVINVAEAKNPKLTLASTSLYYGEASFKATLKGVDGKVLKNAAVIFKVNGKKVKTVKTNAKGIAVFKLTNLPKKYKVTATYGKVSQTKTVTVKRVLSLANTIVKKSANYAFLKATLKKGKTPIKNKVVIFKFNGKTFKAKTNAKGIAQVAVKKAFFYKLAVGKKIICQATYIKDTLKKVAIVRR